MQIPPSDPRLAWEGAVSAESSDAWTMPWRIPHTERDLFYPEALQERAAMPSGVRLRFRSDTARVAGRIDPMPEMPPLDLCCDGERVGSVPMADRETFAFDGLPAGMKRLELWLPQFQPFRLRSFELSDGAALEPAADDRPRWITYGSSITHCRGAESPTLTWPAIVARERGLHLTCFGFGGQCHLDPMIARLIRDLPADVISLKLGINIKGAASLSPRSFRPAVLGSVRTIRDGHPDVPIVVLSPILAVPHEDEPNAVGFTVQMMRTEVAAAVDVLRAHGDANVHYVSGLELLGPDEEHLLLEDGVHPGAEGYKTMGRNFLAKVAPQWFPEGTGATG